MHLHTNTSTLILITTVPSLLYHPHAGGLGKMPGVYYTVESSGVEHLAAKLGTAVVKALNGTSHEVSEGEQKVSTEALEDVALQEEQHQPAVWFDTVVDVCVKRNNQ
jgi:hypothetical protein